MGRIYPIEEIIKKELSAETPKITLISNGIFALIQLEQFQEAESFLEMIKEVKECSEVYRCLSAAMQGISSIEELQLSTTLNREEERLIQYLLVLTIKRRQLHRTHQLLKKLEGKSVSGYCDVAIKSAIACLHMLEHNWKGAEEIFLTFPLELLNQESTPSIFSTAVGCIILKERTLLLSILWESLTSPIHVPGPFSVIILAGSSQK